MPTMSTYCKAYLLKDLRAFAGWSEPAGYLRTETAETDAGPVDSQRALADDDYVFLHDNLTVSDGIFVDEQVLFSAATPEWQAFCRDTLQFEVPDFEKEHQEQLSAAAAAAQ